MPALLLTKKDDKVDAPVEHRKLGIESRIRLYSTTHISLVHTISGKVQSHVQTTEPTGLKKVPSLVSGFTRLGLLSLLVGSTRFFSFFLL